MGVDLRYTYICAHCGSFAEVSFWSIEAFDNGTTLTCDKCGEDTVLLLLTPKAYRNVVNRNLTPVAPDRARRDILREQAKTRQLIKESRSFG